METQKKCVIKKFPVFLKKYNKILAKFSTFFSKITDGLFLHFRTTARLKRTRIEEKETIYILSVHTRLLSFTAKIVLSTRIVPQCDHITNSKYIFLSVRSAGWYDAIL